MKLFILLSLISAATQAADLKDRAREERLWSKTEMRISDSPNQIAGSVFITPNQSWRIDNIRGELELSAPLISRDAAEIGTERYLRLCRRMGYGFVAAREHQSPHKLTLRIPNWSLSPSGDVTIDVPSSNRLLTLPANPLRIVSIRTRIAFDPKANTLLYSNLDPRVIERLIESQVQNQADQLRVEGRINIDIRGHDYVACDYAQGLMQIALEVVWEYPAPKLARQPTVSATDLQKALNIAKSTPLEGSCPERNTLASAFLGYSLGSLLKNTVWDMGRGTFQSLFNAVYDQNLCRWRDSIGDFSALSAEFDVLSERLIQSSAVVFTRFNGEVLP